MTHTPKELEIMAEYEAAVDPEIIDFVQDVRAERDTLPLTVAFLSEDAAYEIEKLTHLLVTGKKAWDKMGWQEKKLNIIVPPAR